MSSCRHWRIELEIMREVLPVNSSLMALRVKIFIRSRAELRDFFFFFCSVNAIERSLLRAVICPAYLSLHFQLFLDSLLYMTSFKVIHLQAKPDIIGKILPFHSLARYFTNWMKDF